MIGTTRSRASLALVALLFAIGCSGGDDSGDDSGDDVASVDDDEAEDTPTDSESEDEQALFDWVDCMRGEGLDLPDPTRDADGNLVVNGGGISIGTGGEGGSGVNTRDPSDDEAEEEEQLDPAEMQAATEVCGPPPAASGAEDISDEDRQAQQDAALEFADCMREQGIEDFPDPDFSEQGPGGQISSAEPGDGDGDGDGDGSSGPVMGGPFGQIDMGDPETAAAFEACQDVLGGPEGDRLPPPAEGSGT